MTWIARAQRYLGNELFRKQCLEVLRVPQQVQKTMECSGRADNKVWRSSILSERLLLVIPLFMSRPKWNGVVGSPPQGVLEGNPVTN